jgi:hypothetical protein
VYGGIDDSGRPDLQGTRHDGWVKTIQLRRYILVDGEYDAFVAWWREELPTLRAAAGFTIEFAYGIRETGEFVWAVSAPGDREAFLALEAEYVASDARAAVFEGVPQRIAVADIRLVDDEQPLADDEQPPVEDEQLAR